MLLVLTVGLKHSGQILLGEPNFSTMVSRIFITELPNELIDKIFKLIANPIDIAALTYSSHRFWLLAEAEKYNTVAITTRTRNATFQSAIRLRPQRAAVVRHLLVDTTQGWYDEEGKPHEVDVKDNEDDEDAFTSSSTDENSVDDEVPTMYDIDSEFSTLPLLVNLKTCRLITHQPYPPKPLQRVLERAARGLVYDGRLF